MKKIFKFLLCIGLSIPMLSTAQETSIFISDCLEITVNVDPDLPVGNSLYTPIFEGDCSGVKIGFGGAHVPGLTHTLQRLEPDGTWKNGPWKSTSTYSTVFASSWIKAGYQYRVHTRKNYGTTIPHTHFYDHCDQNGWVYTPLVWDDFYSNQVETHSSITISEQRLVELSGTPLNDNICFPDPALLSLGNVTGEDRYLLQIHGITDGGSQLWNTLGWQYEQVPNSGLINVEKILQGIPGSGWYKPDWKLWPGTYTITFSVMQGGCIGWTYQTHTLRVWDTGGPCRTGQVEEEKPKITLYPNPASHQIQFRNMEYYESGTPIQYTVFDISGKQMLNGVLLSSEEAIDIGYLPNGMYVVHILAGEERIIKKFTKVSGA